MRRTMMLAGLCALGLAGLQAQSPFSVNVGGGFTNPEYSAGERLNTGWNVALGLGVMPARYAGLRGEFQYNKWDVNTATLNAIGFPAGTSSVWSLTLNPTLRTDPEAPVGAYIIGGGGLYRRNLQFTQPTVITTTVFDPFFGIFYPVNFPANQVLSEASVLKGGLNGGAGLTFGRGGRVNFYAEARYHHMFTRPEATAFVPVTFGIRF